MYNNNYSYIANRLLYVLYINYYVDYYLDYNKYTDYSGV